MKRIVNITIIKKIGKLEKNWKVKKGLEKGLKARNREKEPGGWGLGIGKKVGGWGLILIISNWRFFIVDGNVWNLKKFCTFFKLLSTAPGPFHPPTTGGEVKPARGIFSFNFYNFNEFYWWIWTISLFLFLLLFS